MKSLSMCNTALRVGTLAALLVFGACTTAPTEAVKPPPQASLYERFGGYDAISAIIHDSIGTIATDPRISRRFSKDGVGQLTKNLVDLVCARSGGPCVYTGRNMADAHEGMYIRDEEFDALLEDLAKSFDKFKVPAREQAEALAALRQMKNAIVGH